LLVGWRVGVGGWVWSMMMMMMMMMMMSMSKSRVGGVPKTNTKKKQMDYESAPW
jgi:hypothetical protein